VTPPIARLHVAAWRETYRGLLPDEVLAGLDEDRRRAVWTEAIAAGNARIALVEGAGFASMGTQRDKLLAEEGYGEELFAIYILRAGQGRGLGRALLRAVMPARPAAWTVLVLDGNVSAIGF
jgi:GNAT superfamily N-acetyltransferase